MPKVSVIASDRLELDDLCPVRAEGIELVLVRTRSGLVAMDNACPHMGRSLETGKVEGDSVTCRHHGVRIELESGRVLNDAGFVSLEAVRTYVVEERDGLIWVDLP